MGTDNPAGGCLKSFKKSLGKYKHATLSRFFIYFFLHQSHIYQDKIQGFDYSVTKHANSFYLLYVQLYHLRQQTEKKHLVKLKISSLILKE